VHTRAEVEVQAKVCVRIGFAGGFNG